MSNEKQAILVIASPLLGYPSIEFMEELKELKMLSEDALDSNAIKDEFLKI